MKCHALFKIWVQPYRQTASLERVWETLRCSIYDHMNGQILNFHIITPQIPTCKAPNRFQKSSKVKYFKVIKRLKSQKRISKSRGVFRTQVGIYDGAFLWVHLTAYYFRNKSSITNVRLGYIQASENMEIFNVKL